MDDLGIAETVVIRHRCHCTPIAEPPHDTAIEHVFTVDGDDFPWHIHERGPLVTRLTDDLYTVDVELYGIDKDTMKSLSFGYSDEGYSSVPFIPVIGGRKFPWTLADAEIILRFSHKIIPTLRLKFLARNVDAKGIEVDDQRHIWGDRAIYRAGGDLVHQGKKHCSECDQWVDDLFDHRQAKHPRRHRLRVP